MRVLAGLIVLTGIGIAAAPADAAFPGTNGTIAFESGLLAPRVSTVAADGTGLGELPGPNGRDPSWSPDGTRLAFTETVDGAADIVIREPDGSLTRVAASPAADTDPAFSPDGGSLAFTSTRDGDTEVYTVELATGVVRRLTTTPGRDQQPAWSSRNVIAFGSERAGGTPPDLDLWVMAPDGTGARPLTANDRLDADPSWSPDGSALAFTSGAPRRFGLFVVSADGGAASRVDAQGSAHFPAWSPDGRRIAYSEEELFGASLGIAVAPGAPAEPSPPALFTEGTDPNWQPLPPPPPDPAVPPPDAGTVFVREVRNGVAVSPGSADPVSPLQGAAVLPAASTLDVSGRSSASITAATTGGVPITATVSGGLVAIRRRAESDPLRLKVRLGQPTCPRRRRGAAARRPRLGPFRTRTTSRAQTVANHGRASARGTTWHITEVCAGTRYRVLDGSILVTGAPGGPRRVRAGDPPFLVPRPRR